MNVLLTGGAGRIGSAFYAETADRFWFRVADRAELPYPLRDTHEFVDLDIADLDACRAACVGIDCVVHLAAEPRPEAGFYESLLDNNIKGAFNIFRAAKDAGCRRVVFASSGHAIAGYPHDSPIGTDVPVNPFTLYGATKCFGEALCCYFSNAEELSCIAVRIGSYEARWIHEQPTPANLSSYVSPRDINQLFVKCVEAPESLRFAIVNGQSDNSIKRMDLTSTRAVVGYDPQDDAFAIFGVAPSG